MTRFPDDDRQLRAFLKQYRPVPPPATPEWETHLMGRIARLSRPSQVKRSPSLWQVWGAIAASSLLAWASYRWLQPAPPMAAHREELEAFLIETWTGAAGEAPEAVPSSSDWLFLGEEATGEETIE